MPSISGVVLFERFYDDCPLCSKMISRRVGGGEVGKFKLSLLIVGLGFVEEV